MGVFVVVLGVVVSLLLLGAWYMGLFRKILFSEGHSPAGTFVYVLNVGSYSSVGPIFKQLYKVKGELLGKEKGVRCAMIGFDDPSKTMSTECRSACGMILPSKYRMKADRVASELKKLGFLAEKREMRAARVVHTYFPCRNLVSYMIAPARVYPAFSGSEYARAGLVRGSPMEVYHGSQIEFMWPLEHGEQFMHPKHH